MKFSVISVMLLAGLGAAVPALAQSSVPDAAPAYTVPVAPNYLIAPGDVLSVMVADWPSNSVPQTTVAPDGTVSIPMLGQIRVTGKTVAQATTLLTTRLKKYIIDPSVTVSLVQKHAQFVVFSGSVNRPGLLEYRPGLRLMEALAQVGGFVISGSPAAGSSAMVGLQTTIADPSHVSIAHEDGTRQVVNLTHPESLAGTPVDVLLEPGDVVSVPEQLGKINVTGQVNHPGVIPYRDNMTLLDAISASGGYSPETADLPNSSLTHNGKTMPLNLEPMLLHGDLSANTMLAPGDQISIGEKVRTYVAGDVYRGGYYLYRPGDRVLDAISAVGGYTQQADLSKINILHTDKVHHTSQMVRVDLNSYLLRDNPAGNPYIQPGDALYIPDKQQKITLGQVFAGLSGASQGIYGYNALTGR